VLDSNKFQRGASLHALARIKRCLHESLRRSHKRPMRTAASPTDSSLLIPLTSRVSPTVLAPSLCLSARTAIGVQMQVGDGSRDDFSRRHS
jgi:hypothetical protein